MRKTDRQRHHRLIALLRQTRLLLAALPALTLQAQQAGTTFSYSRIPLLTINTVDSVMPTYTVVEPDDGSYAIGIKSEHVPGRMTITLDGQTVYDSGDYVKGSSGMRLKVRGNSTGANLAQKPYKLKLSVKADLLRRGNADFRHKDWALLSMYTWNTAFPNNQSNLTTMTGLIVNRLVGMDWTPQMAYVNLVLNGQYKGLYQLIETVDKGKTRIDVDKSGYIVENDRQFWNEDLYFRTDRMYEYHGWTYKYPDEDDVTETITDQIRDYINAFETALYDGGDVSDYIDLTSFARWLLAHDILGSTDYHGCNMFVSKKDYVPASPTSTKLRMPVLWDFDSSFRAGDGNWSNQHLFDTYYFPKLLERPEFVAAYIAAWDEVSPTFLQRFQAAYDSILTVYGTTFDESRQFHRAVYPSECPRDFKTQVSEQIELMAARLSTMETLVEGLRDQALGIAVPTVSAGSGQREVFDLYGRSYGDADLTALPRGVYIVRDGQGRVAKVQR